MPMAESSGLSRMEATRPVKSSKDPARAATPAQHAANRKSERMARRELLYVVVREAMARVGVLSSTYKFKVLSLDSRGRQFLVMMDVALEFGNDAGRLAEIEALIAQSSKSRHDIVVTAVYWRVNEYVATGLPVKSTPISAHRKPAAGVASPAPEIALPLAAAAAVAALPVSRHDPIDDAEVAAFKQALANASATPQVPVPAKDKTNTSYGLLNGYEDTEMPEQDNEAQALSATQYGGL
ncbi:MAG: hypothetical protein ACKVOO_01080 [Burkholderiaceae bacterium]